MFPAKAEKMEKRMESEEQIEKSKPGTERGSSRLSVYHRMNRREQRKWRDLWTWAFTQDIGAREKVRMCENCYRIDRKAQANKRCSEEHRRIGTMEIKEIYSMKSVAGMVEYFDSIWREDPGRSNLPVELPIMGLKRRRKDKSK